MDDRELDPLTASTVALLQTLIRNECVNDGTAESGHETRNADVLQGVIEGSGVVVERFGPSADRMSIIGRIEGSDPDAPSLCLMGHTDVVPVNHDGWDNDPFGGELITSPDGVDEVWGRGAVDMLNLTASMAVAFRHLADDAAAGRFKPTGDLIYFGVADEEAGSAHGARWVADNHADSMRADYVLTENGGIHSGPAESPFVSVNVAEKGVAWRRLTVRGTPGHGSTPFRGDNALVKAAGVVQRLADYRSKPRFTELWRTRVETLGLTPEWADALLDESKIDGFLDDLPVPKLAAYLHACTHTTFSPNLLDGGLMKTNVVPDTVVIEVDVRTLPGDGPDEVAEHLRNALGDLADHVEVEPIMNDESSISQTDTPLWDALHRAVNVPFPTATLTPQMIVGFTDSRIYREMGAVAYGAGLLSPSLDSSEFGSRFHGHNERIDVESLALTTRLWDHVCRDLLSK
jgi:acetylornithine deacetylase/succinyl-diaminopimelate desuccinylase-like protein